MPRLDAAFVLRATGAALAGRPPAAPLAGVSTDTRTLAPGELFVALKGPNFDGHAFLARAAAAGAAAAVVAADCRPPEGLTLPLFRVADPLAALGDLAGAWRREFTLPVAAITGSSGKTTSKEMLASILATRHRVLKNQGNFNNLIGLPLTLLTLGPAHDAAVLEMGMSARGEIRRLASLTAPGVGLVTNVGPAHVGLLGSLEAVAAAKAELYEELAPSATAAVNLDDPFLAPLAGRLACRVVTFGQGGEAMVRGADLAALGSRQAFNLYLPDGQAVRPRLPVPGRHNVQNALGAAAAAWALGLSPAEIKAGLEAFTPLPGRLTVVKGKYGPWLLDDTYNANPASVAAGVQALSVIAAGRPMGLVLGDMKELGGFADRLHYETGLAAARGGCRVVLALGEHAAEVVRGAREGGAEVAEAFCDRDRLASRGRELFSERDVVLVKGSHSMAMDQVVTLLRGEEGAWY